MSNETQTAPDLPECHACNEVSLQAGDEEPAHDYGFLCEACWDIARGNVRRMPPGVCGLCDNSDELPSHGGDEWCKSGSIAAGGKKSHCTCDMCF